MKSAVLILALCLAAPASAQTPQVMIEDDVSHDNAMQCAALRASQVAAGAPDPLAKAAHEAWLKSLESAHGAKIREHVAVLARSVTPQQIARIDRDCAPFEIRAAKSAG